MPQLELPFILYSSMVLAGILKSTGFFMREIPALQEVEGVCRESVAELVKYVFWAGKCTGFYVGDILLHGAGNIVGFQQKIFGKFRRLFG